ncbi:MAG: hypothetical protein V1799_11465 [bacterium]
MIVIAGIFDRLFGGSRSDQAMKLYDSLEPLGYAAVPSTDNTMMSTVRSLRPIPGGIFVVKKSLVQSRSLGIRYICDLHMQLRLSPGQAAVSEWTILTQNQPIALTSSLIITPRLIAYEVLFKHSQLMHEVLLDLDRSFVDFYYAFARNARGVTVPKSFQQTMNSLSTSFPFRSDKESTSIAYFTPRGWSILCDRLRKPDWFSELIKAANTIEESVAAFNAE